MEAKPSKKNEGFQRVRYAVATLLLVLFAAMPVSAVSINFSAIVVVLSNVTQVILPQFLNLVIAALPIIVVLAICGFIVAFIDKILALIKF